MDGVSSAFAVVSLAVQLVGTGQEISKFLSNVQDAPTEVTNLAQTLDQLNSTLKQVTFLLEQQYLVLRLPGSPVFITEALRNCERRITSLEEIVKKAKQSFGHRNHLRRSWAAMSFVSKKEDIQEMQNHLRDSQIGLQTAMLSNSWQLQMVQIAQSGSSDLQEPAIQESPSIPSLSNTTQQYEETRILRSSNSKDTFCSTIKETNLVWYRSLLGSVNIQTKSKSLSRSDARRPATKAIASEKVITIRPTFLRQAFELRLANSFGKISRTLSTYSILETDAPIFQMCHAGDIQGVQVAFSSGRVSPFVLDAAGHSLLHYVAVQGRLDMCAMLLQLGVDPNRMSESGRKAMVITGYSKNESRIFSVDTLRLLVQSQNDVSLSDMSKFWQEYDGSVEGAEFMFLQDLAQSESDFSDGEYPYPPLATALRLFGARRPGWENFLRLLRPKSGGLHLPVPREISIEILNSFLCPVYPCKVLKYGTPLDELFASTDTRFEGMAAADRWLHFLSSEGYDVKAYLEEEQALHAAQMQLTYPSRHWETYDNPRQLIYHWGSNPSVHWDRWIDPNSSTYLVREEYKHMDIIGRGDWLLRLGSWERPWPLVFPAWSKHFSPYEKNEYELLYELAQKRANRRTKKKAAKAARAQGLKNRATMPGAWPV